MQRAERNRCPEEFQQRIREAGGLNRYDEPNFRLVWGQTETFWAGGIWEAPYHFEGYREITCGFNAPCWILQEWRPPEDFEGPVAYYIKNRDEAGYQTLGEYPYQGRYENRLNLSVKTIEKGQLKIETAPLTSLLIDMMIPVVISMRNLSIWKRKAMLETMKAAEDAELEKGIDERLNAARVAFGGKSRAGGVLQCNSVVQKRMDAIEQYWAYAVKTLRGRGRGISIGRPN